MFGAAGSVLLAEWRVGLIGVSYTAQGAVRIHAPCQGFLGHRHGHAGLHGREHPRHHDGLVRPVRALEVAAVDAG